MKKFLLLLFTSSLVIYVAYLLSFSSQMSDRTGQIKLPPLQNGSNSPKVIILAFDDSPKSQFTLVETHFG